jgi:hypothetical protein
VFAHQPINPFTLILLRKNKNKNYTRHKFTQKCFFLLKNDLETPPNKSLLCKKPSFDHFHNFFQFSGQIKNQNDLSSVDDYFLEWSELANYCYLVNGANL